MCVSVSEGVCVCECVCVYDCVSECVCECVSVRETEIGRKSSCGSLGQSQGKAHTGFLSSKTDIPLPLSLWVILLL